MSQVTPPSSRALLLYACAERTSPFYPFPFFVLSDSRKCRRMQDTTGVNLHLRPFPAVIFFLSSNRLALLLPDGAMADKTIWRQVPPAEHLQPQAMPAWQWRLQDFRHGGRKATLSPWPVAPPFSLFPFSFPPLQVYGQCSHAAIPDGISGHFRCRGKGKDGIRNTNFLATISTPC